MMAGTVRRTGAGSHLLPVQVGHTFPGHFLQCLFSLTYSRPHPRGPAINTINFYSNSSYQRLSLSGKIFLSPQVGLGHFLWGPSTLLQVGSPRASAAPLGPWAGPVGTQSLRTQEVLGRNELFRHCSEEWKVCTCPISACWLVAFSTPTPINALHFATAGP